MEPELAKQECQDTTFMGLVASNAENLPPNWQIEATSPFPDNWSRNGRVSDIEQRELYLKILYTI